MINQEWVYCFLGNLEQRDFVNGFVALIETTLGCFDLGMALAGDRPFIYHSSSLIPL